MVKLYSDYFERKYYARRCSWTNLFYLCVLASVILIPLIFAFATDSFWGAPIPYHGEPEVRYSNEAFVQAQVGTSIK